MAPAMGGVVLTSWRWKGPDVMSVLKYLAQP